jgi:hypothetical protein
MAPGEGIRQQCVGLERRQQPLGFTEPRPFRGMRMRLCALVQIL